LPAGGRQTYSYGERHVRTGEGEVNEGEVVKWVGVENDFLDL